MPVEQFATLSVLPLIRHGFTTRANGVEVSEDKAAALKLLDAAHRDIRVALGVGAMPFATAEQVHGKEVAFIAEPATACATGADGLITNRPGVCLGIYVADCCAVFLIDPVKRAIGLAHSGRKGTELGIASHALEQMRERFGSDPQDVIAQLSPCIRPPHYEVDFAAEIRAQLRTAGVAAIHDSGVCTACDLNRYYSYRAEKGCTGRMLAVLALAPDDKR